MGNTIRSFVLFVSGIAVGILFMQPSAAQESPAAGVRLNHVGIYAKDFDESMRYYTQTIGLREAFTIRDAQGKPTLAYLQINKDQFIEIAPATAERPVGLSHIGILPDNLNRTVAALRSRGVKMNDPATGKTQTTITNATDPNGVRLELLDFLPGSLPRKAIDEWK